MLGGPAAQARHRPLREPANGPTTEPALGAGDEGAGAAPDLDTPTGAVRDGHAPVDEVDGPILRPREPPTAVLPTLRRVRELPAQPHPSEATFPGGPVLVPSRPRDAPLPSAPALYVLRAEASLGLRMGRREPVIPTSPVPGRLPETTGARLIPGKEVGRRVAVAPAIARLAAPILVGQILVATGPRRSTAKAAPASMAVRQDASGLGALIAGTPLANPPTEAAGSNVSAPGFALRKRTDGQAQAEVPGSSRLR